MILKYNVIVSVPKNLLEISLRAKKSLAKQNLILRDRKSVV